MEQIADDDFIVLPTGAIITGLAFKALFNGCDFTYDSLMVRGGEWGYKAIFDQWRDQGLFN